MDRKKLAYVFLAIGSYIGGSIPTLWGASFISFSGIFLSALGGFLGIYLAFLIGQ